MNLISNRVTEWVCNHIKLIGKLVKPIFVVVNFVKRYHLYRDINFIISAWTGAILLAFDKEEENYYRYCALSVVFEPFKRWIKHRWHKNYYHLE